jgi:4-diphosphocytidyl-2-C-methyl-D-erythritol kinase
MLLFPNAKINLGLSVITKRPDNYHNLETVFYPIGLADILEFITGPGYPKGDVSISLTGHKVDGDPGNNLCTKAYQLLCNEFDLPGLSIHLHKIVPIGAGLGGGSADAAFMLKGLNDMFDLKLTYNKLEDYAARLGSDCAFFIRDRPVFAYDRGHKFRDTSLFLDEYYILIVYPFVHISTTQAYSRVIPAMPEISPEKVVQLPIREWKGLLKNDFEKSVFGLYPALKTIKDRVYETGALYASMSGSGSAVFGIYNGMPDIPEDFLSYFTWRGSLKSTDFTERTEQFNAGK